MAYKVKYRLDYCNKEKLNARLDFEIKDYTSTIIHDIVGTQDAFSYKVRNEKPDRSGYFRTLEADINIFEDENFKIDSLLTSDETAIRVKFYIEGQLEFVGFIIPDFFEVSIDKPRVISMVASDRIGTLKNQTLPRQTGVQSFRYMLEQSLLKTGLDLPLNSTINFNPVGETGDFLTNTGGLMERLSSDKGASISCYDVIKSILIVSNSVLFQEGGEWHILNKYEFESRPTTKDIEQINVGGRRLINPPSSKVGVMAEFGGGLKYPTNYNFQSLNGWTAKNGFIAQLNTKQIDGFSNGNPIYGSNVGTSNLLNKNNTEPLTKPDEKPYLESQGIKVVSVNPLKARIKTEINVTTDGSIVYYMIYAKNGNQTKILGPDGFYDGNTGDRGSNLALAFRVGDRDDQSQAYTGSNIIEGVLEDEINVTNWNIYIRIYGTASTITTFVNFAYVEFPSENENKGNLFKIEQGVNFTKENEIDTTIFGDYINKGINGYFYDYQRDEQGSIFYKIGGSWESLGLKWQTASNNNADYLLLHSVRQRAIMFSSPHNIITAVVSGRFSALDIYNVCGSKYVLVEAEYDFYRNETELRIEEIKYDNSVLKTDYIYSYFGGEDTTSISGVSGVSSGGSSGGGGAPCLIKIDDDGNYYVEENFYSLKDVSAFGKDELGGGGGDGVALTSWVDQITTLTDFNQGSNFIKISDVEAKGYATETYVDNAISNIDVDLTGYATIDYVDTAISNLDLGVNDLFEKEVISGKTYIKAKHSLYSTGDLSAFGKDNLGGGGTGGGTDLVSWVDQIMALTDFNVGSNFIDISDVEAKGYATVTQVNAIDTRLVTVESNYTTQSDIDSAIDAIEIGGRNLIKDSQHVWTYPNNTGLGIATLMSDENEPYYTVVATGPYVSTYGFDGSFDASRFSEPMVDGATYTVSVDVRAPRTGTVGFYNNRGLQSLLKVNEWVRIKHTYIYSGMSYRVIGLTFNSSTIDYRNWKIEKGNKATDWTPAPEDQVSDWNETDVASFSYIKNKPTKLSQFSNVETDFVSKTYVDNTFTTLSNFNTHASNTDLHKTQSDRDAIASFLSMFEMDGDFIKAKKSLYSTGDLSAFGKDNLGGGGTGGGTDLVSWVDQIMALTDFNVGSNFIDISDVEAKGYATVTQVNAIDTRLVTVESNYTTQSDIDSAIDDLEIGGRNLARLTNSGEWIRYIGGVISLGEYKGLTTVKTTDDGSGYIGIEQGSNARKMLLRAGEQYIISLLIRGTVPLTYNYIMHTGTSNNSFRSFTYEQPLNEETFVKAYAKITATANYELSTGSWFMTRPTVINDGDWVEITQLKIEKGNKATDWTPAPEDQISDWLTTDENAFDYIKNKPTKLSQFSNVETDFTSKTYVTTELNKKVDKVTGKSLISDTEISRLSTVVNQTATSIGLGNVPNLDFRNYGLGARTAIDDIDRTDFNTGLYTLASGGANNPTSSSASVLYMDSGETGYKTQLLQPINTNDEVRAYIRHNKNNVGSWAPWQELYHTGYTKPIGVGTGWTLSQVGTELQFKYNGTIKARMTADGHIIAHGDVTAFG